MSARLTVSLTALESNYQRLAKHACSEVAAVVKADGYGLGAATVSRRLQQQGCREFFVATAREGVSLRDAIPDVIIYVLEGAYSDSVDQLVRSELVPVLNTPAQILAWSNTNKPAALHVDTGMQRLGFSAAAGLGAIPDVSFPLSLLVSHFARADEPGHSSIALQQEQISQFHAALQQRHPGMRLSMCNSAALLDGLGPEDLGRAGIGLYGGNPFHGQANPMVDVVKLEARVLQIRTIAQGMPVGYGASFVAPGNMRLATLGVGYADGLPRLLSNQGRAVVAGKDCPMVGRISMDLTTIDITGLDSDENLDEGDWVEVIGPQVKLDDVASQAKTLAYEILTGISARVERTYVEGFD